MLHLLARCLLAASGLLLLGLPGHALGQTRLLPTGLALEEPLVMPALQVAFSASLNRASAMREIEGKCRTVA
ncbi:hypothetical protein H8B13_03490 [Hymenobacter sp. BT188]|uniref:hypothetical protein n=1 Tax=Hymenobacter sp. BT188 TaxID=2763504 RepID=UPI001650F0E3|nr:hypothetical protein [Hymenobacter sp. BT188]MBC6605873.1 hypothetical protein [Hymenobacter sp. BT188]